MSTHGGKEIPFLNGSDENNLPAAVTASLVPSFYLKLYDTYLEKMNKLSYTGVTSRFLLERKLFERW